MRSDGEKQAREETRRVLRALAKIERLAAEARARFDSSSLAPRPPIQIKSEDGVKIHPDCELVLNGMPVSGFKVDSFAIEYALPSPSLGGMCGIRGPLPIVRIVVESKGYKASGEEKMGEVHEQETGAEASVR